MILEQGLYACRAIHRGAIYLIERIGPRHEVSICLGPDFVEAFGVSRWKFIAVVDDFGDLIRVAA